VTSRGGYLAVLADDAQDGLLGVVGLPGRAARFLAGAGLLERLPEGAKRDRVIEPGIAQRGPRLTQKAPEGAVCAEEPA